SPGRRTVPGSAASPGRQRAADGKLRQRWPCPDRPLVPTRSQDRPRRSVTVAASAAARRATPSPMSARAVWLLEQEARALRTRLAMVKPFVLEETMVPAAALSPAAV